MTLERFWSIVGEVHQNSRGDMDRKCQLLEERLRQWSLDEVRSFAEHFTELRDRAYSWELWAAASIIGHGCSDDKFSDFRSTLISMGRETYDRAIADPQSLADMNYDADIAHYEGYSYAVFGVFNEKSTGEDFRRPRPHPKNPSGYDWSE